MMRISLMSAAVFGVLFVHAAGSVPQVTVTSIEQKRQRDVEVTYTLSGGPAIVTVDFLTNGVTVGSEHFADTTEGAFVRVTEDGSHKIVWHARQGMPDSEADALSAKLTAWSLSSPPTYMTLALTNTTAVAPRYYPAGCLPGGVLDTRYRTSHLLMKKVAARGIPWYMGEQDGSRQQWAGAGQRRLVTLTNDYYLGVFEVTQCQWTNVIVRNVAQKSYVCHASYFSKNGEMRPAELCIMGGTQMIRTGHVNDNWKNPKGDAYYYPGAPYAESWLGLLRAKTGGTVAFDLPSEAQWEYAGRAGQPPGRWNNGAAYYLPTDDQYHSSNFPGRYKVNGTDLSTSTPAVASAVDDTAASYDTDKGTAICGSYAPSAWGFYDMHGNVAEWCLDYYAASPWGYEGAEYGRPNADGKETGLAAGSNVEKCVLKGGAWSDAADALRQSHKADYGYWSGRNCFGFRLALTLP